MLKLLYFHVVEKLSPGSASVCWVCPQSFRQIQAVKSVIGTGSQVGTHFALHVVCIFAILWSFMSFIG